MRGLDCLTGMKTLQRNDLLFPMFPIELAGIATIWLGGHHLFLQLSLPDLRLVHRPQYGWKACDIAANSASSEIATLQHACSIGGISGVPPGLEENTLPLRLMEQN